MKRGRGRVRKKRERARDAERERESAMQREEGREQMIEQTKRKKQTAKEQNEK